MPWKMGKRSWSPSCRVRWFLLLQSFKMQKKFWEVIKDTPGESFSHQTIPADFMNQWWLFRKADSDLYLLHWQLQHSLFHYLFCTFRFSFFILIVLLFCLLFSQKFKKIIKHFWPLLVDFSNNGGFFLEISVLRNIIISWGFYLPNCPKL